MLCVQFYLKKDIFTIYKFIKNTAMLQLLRLTLVIAIASFIVSCDKERQDDSLLLEGSQWKLKACINTVTGEVQFLPTSQSAEITFLKGERYYFASGSKGFQSSYKLKSETGSASFCRSAKPIAFSSTINAYLTTTLRSTNYEIAGNCLKISSPSTNRFLIFERIK